MPVTLAHMAAREKSLAITGGPLGEDTINLVYYPNKLTAKIINQFELGLDGMNQSLAEILKSWDVLESEGGPMWPTDAESIARLGVPVLVLIGQAIADDIRPN